MAKEDPVWLDQRPEPKEWEEEFGEQRWNSKDVEDQLSKEAVKVLWNCMKGRKITEFQRRAAEFVANSKAWPKVQENNTININVLRLEDLERAKMKAGLVKVPKLITNSED